VRPLRNRGSPPSDVCSGHGREAITFVQANRVSAVEAGRAQRIGGILGHGLAYVLIGLAAFVVVTFLTSRG